MKRTQLLLAAIAIAAIAVALTNCAGLSFAISTPYGDASKDALGKVSIVIPAK